MEKWIREYALDDFLFFQDLDALFSSGGVKRGIEDDTSLVSERCKVIAARYKRSYEKAFLKPIMEIHDIRTAVIRRLATEGMTLKTEKFLRTDREIRRLATRVPGKAPRATVNLANVSDECILRLSALLAL